MKRTSILERDPAKAVAWRKRSPRIRRMSAKQQAFNAQFNRTKVVVLLRSGGFCEAKASPKCRWFAEHFHHRAGRVGLGANDPDRILHVCCACHGWIHGHPAESYAAGWLLKRLGSAA